MMDRITLADIERLENMGKALRDLGDLSNIKIPKVTMPKNGVVPGVAPTTPGTTPVIPATSGVEQVAPGVQQAGKALDDINEEIRLWQALNDLLTWVATTASDDDTVKRNFPGAMVLLSNGVESVLDRHATLLQEYQKQRSGKSPS